MEKRVNIKLNRSFFVNTALTITLLTSATLSANAKEVNNYGEGQKNPQTHQKSLKLKI